MLVRIVELLRRGDLRVLPGAMLDLPVNEAVSLIEAGTAVPVNADVAVERRRGTHA